MLQFSAQATNTLQEFELRVNGLRVPQFTDVGYGEVTDFVDVSELDPNPDNPLLYSLTLLIEGKEVSSSNYILSTLYPSSYFVYSGTGGEGIETYLAYDNFTKPEQYNGLWRIADFSPVDNEFSLTVDGVPVDMTYSLVSEYQSSPSQILTFEVTSTNGTVVLMEINLESGAVITVIFNGDQDTGATQYSLTYSEDRVYSYATFRVRAVASVPDAGFDNLTVIFRSTFEDQVMWSGLQYGDITDYKDVIVDNYVVYFTQSGEIHSQTPFVSLSPTSSSSFSVTYQGSPEIGVEVTGGVIADTSEAPTYKELWLQLIELSPSDESTPAAIFINDQLTSSFQYPESSGYLRIDTIPFTVSIESWNATFYYSETFNNVEFSSAYSLYLMGLYPEIDSFLETDFSASPSTTTTTETSTTGDSDDEEDDDDDNDLSGGAIAGIVIGVLVGVVLLGGLTYYVVNRRRRSDFQTIG